MRLGGRLQAAIEILEDIEAKKRPASDALKDWGSSHRFAGAGDRAVIGNIVYDALRRKLSLGWRMGSDSATCLAYGALLSDGGFTYETLSEAIANDKFSPPELSGDQIDHWRNSDITQAEDYIQADVPLWCVEKLRGTFGDDWVAQAAALADRPPVDLRVNRLKASREQVLQSLEGSGAKPAPFLDDAVRIPPIEALGRHPNVQTGQAFQDGWFEVQDLGSQIAAKLARAKAGEQILDYCAGAGGKTLALAAEMENRGQIHAFDAEAARLSPIYDRLQRAGVRNTQGYNKQTDLEPLKGQMDVVLTDAPCTGAGTWRRRPDAKWRLTEQQLERREQDQQEVLNSAKHYLKTGGRFIYVTCSIFNSENNLQIEKFLAENSDFSEEKIDISTISGADFGDVQPVFLSHGCVFSPKQTMTDGFYVAVLKKRG
ncbi:RsmB/NOP family class I SAM-dependent RNA methyltransferase [Brucellaceae bacterium C25G]